eukprot:2801093-Amphidinium_carterae.1
MEVSPEEEPAAVDVTIVQPDEPEEEAELLETPESLEPLTVATRAARSALQDRLTCSETHFEIAVNLTGKQRFDLETVVQTLSHVCEGSARAWSVLADLHDTMDLSRARRTEWVHEFATRIQVDVPWLTVPAIEVYLQDTLTSLFIARESVSDLWHDMLAGLTRRQRSPTWELLLEAAGFPARRPLPQRLQPPRKYPKPKQPPQPQPPMSSTQPPQQQTQQQHQAQLQAQAREPAQAQDPAQAQASALIQAQPQQLQQQQQAQSTGIAPAVPVVDLEVSATRRANKMPASAATGSTVMEQGIAQTQPASVLSSSAQCSMRESGVSISSKAACKLPSGALPPPPPPAPDGIVTRKRAFEIVSEKWESEEEFASLSQPGKRASKSGCMGVPPPPPPRGPLDIMKVPKPPAAPKAGGSLPPPPPMHKSMPKTASVRLVPFVSPPPPPVLPADGVCSKPAEGAP